MEIALVVLALVVTLVALAVAAHRRAQQLPRNDMLRSGDSPELDARDAALAAGGRNAWMRFGGGSG